MKHGALALATVLAFAAWTRWYAAVMGTAVTEPRLHVAAAVRLHAGQSTIVPDALPRPTFVVFGYVGCAETCPLTLRALDRAIARGRFRDHDVLFVDIDPATDTPGMIAEFARRFRYVTGATGSLPDLIALETSLGSWPVRDARDVARHDARIFELDRHGVVERTFDPAAVASVIALPS